MNSQDFMEQADEIVEEFYKAVRTDAEFDGADPVADSVFFDREELGKLHRRVWLEWARKQKSQGEKVPEGWLTEFSKQTDAHKEVQKDQAAMLFALGYLARMEDEKGHSEQSIEKLKSVEPTKRSTIQAFTSGEARFLIAAFCAFVKYNMKKRNIAVEKAVVDRLLAKLSVLADVNLDHIDYFQLQTAESAARVKPKWKKHQKAGHNKKRRPSKSRQGLSHLVGKKK